jgi:hypothetical protein
LSVPEQAFRRPSFIMASLLFSNARSFHLLSARAFFRRRFPSSKSPLQPGRLSARPRLRNQ